MKKIVEYSETPPEPMMLHDRDLLTEDFVSLVKAYARCGFSDHLNPSMVQRLINKGLPVSELEELHVKLGIPLDQLALKLGISKATLHRRKAAGQLDRQESDRVVRFARLFGMATQVMESPAGARAWLTSPQYGLGGAIPLDYAETDWGAREVEDLLGRIEYGVYS